MANLKKKFSEIMQDLEKNIKNKDDLEYVKSQIYNISILFLDELDKISELNFKKMNILVDKEKELSKKMAVLEKIVGNIEKEMYAASECDFEIICPYCNTQFVEDFTDGIKREVRCPECDNVIELDWNEEEIKANEYEDTEEDIEDEEEFDEDEYEENDNEDDM